LRRQTPAEQSCALISGGEFSCPVRGEGIGGRNTETVLRCALEWAAHAKENPPAAPPFVILSAGTDGIDGNSPAAGALCDETTVRRAREMNLDAESSLAASDAYTFFHALGDALHTGPTGTNVRDLRIFLSVQSSRFKVQS
ncbi:MAG: MOFRL family protein, partial [Pyrinomonadaceae bacterium]